ncbi:unnamed protein product, partial [Ascophyllum nodosum]
DGTYLEGGDGNRRPQRRAGATDDDHAPSSARDSTCCDGRRETGKNHGAARTPLQAPDSEGLIGGRKPKDSKCSVWGDKSHFIRQHHREEPRIIHGGRLTSAHGELLAHHEDPINISS